jgi:hypothetical protein
MSIVLPIANVLNFSLLSLKGQLCQQNSFAVLLLSSNPIAISAKENLI